MKGKEFFIRRPSLSYFIDMKDKSSSYLNKLYALEMLLLLVLTWTMFFIIKYTETTVSESVWFLAVCINISILLLEVPFILISLNTSWLYGEGHKTYAKTLYLIFFALVIILTLWSAYDVYMLI